MSNIARIMQQAAAGAAAGELLAIEDVFSTYLYTGNNSTQTITNGIDLAGEGGLVWIKDRTGAYSHNLVDSERGVNNYLFTDLTSAQFDAGSLRVSSFNSDGFSLGSGSNGTNRSGNNHASWTFRKAPRWFDCVQYTGDGGGPLTVSHNLGVSPGCIIIKRTDSTGDWFAFHRSLSGGFVSNHLKLNTTNASLASSGGMVVSDADFQTYAYAGANDAVNESGATYVAYLFAHDPLGPSGDGSDGLIACGSYTGNGSSNGPEINLGWEPQWVLFKKTNSGDSWSIIDNMRGFVSSGGPDPYLFPNSSGAEGTLSPTDIASPTATGFKLATSDAQYNSSGGTYIYIAIRRGPMREPTSGTEVFDAEVQNGDTQITTGWPVDLLISTYQSRSASNLVGDRLRGSGLILDTDNSDADRALAGAWKFDSNVSATAFDFSSAYPVINWAFRRAPGFFDVVAYTGTGSVSTFAHNLGVKPQMIWTKGRNDTTFGWYVYHEAVTAADQLYLHLTNAAGGGFMNDTEPTDEVFTLGVTSGANASGDPFIAYLFATLPGISKVGSYTGNGSNQTINCGFTGGARFVLIKRTDSTGDWYVWDTARGIVAGNDPHLSLNTTAAEVTTNDSIDPDSSGFVVNQLAATNINVSSATYIYLAIA